MSTNLKDLYDNIKKRTQLKEALKEQTTIVSNLIKHLDINDLKSLSYEELNQLHENIQYTNAFSDIKDEFLTLLKTKKEEKYPELKGVHYFPKLKTLDLSDDIKKSLDETLFKMRVGNYIHPTSPLWNKLKSYLDSVASLGIIEKYYVLTYEEDEEEVDKLILSEYELRKHKECWSLMETLNGMEVSAKNYNDISTCIDNLMQEGYGYIDIGDASITNLFEFENYSYSIYYKMIEDAIVS